jgi:hypothetical protein
VQVCLVYKGNENYSFKKIRGMKKLRMVLMSTAIAASALVFTGCDKDDDNDNNRPRSFELSGSASGSQAEPSNSSSGSANISGTYDSTTNVMNYKIVWTNLSTAPTTAGIFARATGGGSDIGIGSAISLGSAPAASSGEVSGTVTLSADDEVKLLANQAYYVVRTSTYANGEVRGNINTKAKN